MLIPPKQGIALSVWKQFEATLQPPSWGQFKASGLYFTTCLFCMAIFITEIIYIMCGHNFPCFNNWVRCPLLMALVVLVRLGSWVKIKENCGQQRRNPNSYTSRWLSSAMYLSRTIASPHHSLINLEQHILPQQLPFVGKCETGLNV